MDRNEFWRIVAETIPSKGPGSRSGRQEDQEAALRAALERLDPKEILSFRDHLWKSMHDAYRRDLWAVAYLLADGCSEDGFADFRSALVAMGREIYEGALKDPDALWKALEKASIRNLFFEGFQYVPEEVYESVTGQTPPAGKAHPTSAGPKWKSDSELQRNFPSTWNRTRERRKR